MVWVSPTGHEDPSGMWVQEGYAYDSDTTSYAAALGINLVEGEWNIPFLILTHPGVSCNKIRFWIRNSDFDYVDIDVYYDAAWHDVYEGVYAVDEWVEKDIPEGTKLVTKARLRTRSAVTLDHRSLRFYEFDFWGVSGITAPTVTALPASAVTATTARSNGKLTDLGSEAPTVYIYWGTSDGGTTPGDWDHDENLGILGIGTFYKDISSLTRGTKYYYRCYAVNSGGGTWSNVVEFTTLLERPVAATNAATGAGVTVATVNGEVTDDGGESCQYRFKYKKAGGDYVYTEWTGAKTTGETFSEGITGLDASSTYYFNVQVKNSEFESDWGAELTFNTGAAAVAPTGTTNEATLIADIEATLNGKVTGDGGEACEVRFQYGLTDDYGTDTAWQPGKLTGNTFSQKINGLTPNTTYHFRAQIRNSAGTVNGADTTFKTEYFPTPFIRRVLRDVFGGGEDISDANPLQILQIVAHKCEAIVLHASGAETDNGNGADTNVADYLYAESCIDVTAFADMASADLIIEGKDETSGKYKTIQSHNFTGTGTDWLTITVLAFKYVRARWVINTPGASPSITFSIALAGKS